MTTQLSSVQPVSTRTIVPPTPDLLKVAQFLRPYRRWAILAPLAMLLEVAMDLTLPWNVRRIIDQGIAMRDLPFVIQTGALMAVLALIGALGGIGCTYYAIHAAQGFGADLRATLFRKVQALSFGNLDELGVGQLITRLTNDVMQLQEVVAMLLRILVRAPLLMIGGLIMAILTAPQLAFVPLILMVLVVISVALIVRRAYPMYGEAQSRLDTLNTVMQENLAGVRVVKAFVRAAREIERFGKANVALTDQMIRVARITVVTFPLMMLLINAGIVAALWLGGAQVVQRDMQLGQIVAFVNYLQQTLFSLLMVSMLVLQLSRAAASAHRVEELLDSRPDVLDRPQAIADFAPHGRVAFENVTFSYDGHGGEPVLKNINLVAEPGQTVAILGATGAGKSTLVHLIPRFYDVTEGRVTIDGVDVRDVDQGVLRRHIGIALQEAVLFSGTIRDNIRYGRPDATHEEVVEAAKAAQAHDFIMSFPAGYDTIVGQRGVNLSGGQKQRIAIARALLVKPAVLILDDSTSAVDVETEIEIQAALDEMMRTRAHQSRQSRLGTCFVIAQRISTVLNADKIVVLDDGRIVAEGTHSELLAHSSIYRDIYDSQLGDGRVN
ncbi:MAG: ABC transporter ATP-binding protein [Anaerolineae bacterium]|nr:ABC transporter ATP-binding protein/permease [Thermoflexales bacterium]MDW8407932.1 ABC transporter ATP-binding protein [Anaerolineae bacterium]